MNQAAEQPLKRSRTSQILAIYEHTRKRQHPHQRRTAAQPTARDRRAKARAAKDQPPKRGHKCQRPPSQLPKENQQRLMNIFANLIPVHKISQGFEVLTCQVFLREQPFKRKTHLLRDLRAFSGNRCSLVLICNFFWFSLNKILCKFDPLTCFFKGIEVFNVLNKFFFVFQLS